MILRGVIRAINTAKKMYRILTLIHIEFISYICDASLASVVVILNSIKNYTPILVYILFIIIFIISFILSTLKTIQTNEFLFFLGVHYSTS